MTETLKREMTISHSDFFRLLPKALKSYSYQQYENVITISMHKGGRLMPVPSTDVSSGTDLSLSPEGEIRIILSEQRYRQIGSLSLPVADITFN